MATAIMGASEIGTFSSERDDSLDYQQMRNEAVSASSANAVDADGSKGAAKKRNKKKKKKKSKDGGSRQKVVLPSQTLVDQYFPWTAANRPNIGRCAIASRAIKAGEVVVAEQAVAFIPRYQDRLVVCHFCCTDLSPPVSSFECPGCHYSVFCQDCKEEAMREHKMWCHLSSTISESARTADCDADLLHFVLALALKRRPSRSTCGDTVVDECLQKGIIKDGIIYPSYEDAVCLETHSDKTTPVWKASVKKGCQLLYEAAMKVEHSSESVNFTSDELETLAALVNTNSHGMGAHGTGIHNTDVAVGIFPFVSILNHSCRPNCCFASDGRVMYVRATQDIPKDMELCVSYINLYEPRSTRRIQLAETKHFVCCCQRCSEPFASSLDRFLEGCVCTVRGCGGVVVRTSAWNDQDSMASGSSLSSSWQCDQCSRVLDPRMAPYPMKPASLGEHPWLLVARAEQKLAEAMLVYRERRFKDARTLLEQYVAEYTGKLHPLNALLFDALTPLMNCCRAEGDAAEGSRVCRIILNCMEKVLPGISLELANFYFCLGEMYLERSQGAGTNVMIKHYRKLAQETFQHVRMIREICLGKSTLPA